MALDLSVAFPPGKDTPDHIALAESLGYRRAWLYDSPALYHDVWMTLARAATMTSRIGLGPGVVVPSLRHPLVTASAIATLVDLAPGRVAVAVGAGFTGRYLLGHRAMRWADVRAYVEVVRALLRGDEAEWEGRPIRMLHPDGYGPPRPVEVPVLVGAEGPRGTAVAEAVGDGVFAAGVPNAGAAGRWHALLQFGTVLDEGEPVDSARAVEAAGPGVAVTFHALYERGGAESVSRFPGGAAWADAIAGVDPDRRHLATHEDHLVRLSARDRAAMDAGAAAMAPVFTLTGGAAEVRRRLDDLAADPSGVTELAYQPAGPDIPRELRAFAAAAGLEPAG